jgi:hypothetical protein
MLQEKYAKGTSQVEFDWQGDDPLFPLPEGPA